MVKRNSRKRIWESSHRWFWGGSIFLIALFTPATVFGQGFLRTEGQRIVDAAGNNVLLKGIGTGNWMLQEGYMMKSSDIAGTQHEFREKLIETIGEDRTDEFYASWLGNHLRKVDVDSMAAWGFNSVRLAMHYKWYTLPIEEEGIPGENTWLDIGFNLTDSLLSWCAANQMYLILDLHGAPGGQGKNASISDYDPDKPSLWESQLNKDKTIALWSILAERYKDEPWIGGYDLLNEVNWTFPGINNAPLRELYTQITHAIRQHDSSHIIFIEGNDFANNFSGLTPPWDDNMVYSFHKYWSYNDQGSLDWVTQLRDNFDVPLWLGESGENSNVWFTNLVSLCESKNIGWSWWPVKKAGFNNVLEVSYPEKYHKVLEMWRGNGTVSADYAFQAVMEWSEMHRFENCNIKYDVIDALIRQPQTTETLPFQAWTLADRIPAVDFDYGRNNHAYFDTDSMNASFSNANETTWNQGWSYRNDAVDIGSLEDPQGGNGFYVGWIKAGEWLQYTLKHSEAKAYDLNLNTAGENNASVHLAINGQRVSKNTPIDKTNNWYSFQNSSIEGVIFPEGEVQLRVYFDSPGMNFNYFEITNPRSAADMPFTILHAETSELDNEIHIHLNKPVSTTIEDIPISDFQLIVGYSLATITGIVLNTDQANKISLLTDKDLLQTDVIKLSYRGQSIVSNEDSLENFTAYGVENKVAYHHVIPGKVEIEDFYRNNGFAIENCSDLGGGFNSGYADDEDYLDYLLYVENGGKYQLSFRVAALYDSPQILVMLFKDDRFVPIKAVTFNSTGGWQSWQTYSTTVEIPAGKQVFRIYSRSGEHNLNWMEFSDLTHSPSIASHHTRCYPNPVKDMLYIESSGAGTKEIVLLNLHGQIVYIHKYVDSVMQIDVSSFPAGNYFVLLKDDRKVQPFTIQIIK